MISSYGGFGETLQHLYPDIGIDERKIKVKSITSLLFFPSLSFLHAFLSLSPITPFSPFNDRILSTRCGAQSTAVSGLCKSEAHGSAHS